MVHAANMSINEINSRQIQCGRRSDECSCILCTELRNIISIHHKLRNAVNLSQQTIFLFEKQRVFASSFVNPIII